MASISGTRPHAFESRTAQRSTTETKAAPKTTEFVLTVLAIIGVLAAAALINDGSGPNDVDQFIARQAWLYVAILVSAYTVGRGLAKSGSRESYTEGSSKASPRD